MDIERLFKQEVRDKKRIGSSIFSRVSTRRGGSSRELRTPYLYMSRKERKQLNGEVKVYNMNDILDYEEFKSRDEDEQRNLMLHWRENFKSQDIQDKLGVSRTVFYKIIDRLNIPKENTNFKRIDRIILSDEELDKYKSEFIPFDKYRTLTLDQQSLILEAYITEYGGVRAVKKAWEGSDEGYMYSVRSRFGKKLQREKQKELNDSKQVMISTDNASNEVNRVKELKEETEEDKINSAIELLTKLGYSINNNVEEFKEEVNIEVPAKEGNSNIDIKTDSFAFNLNGSYDVKTIKKRLELVLEVIEDDNEVLNLDISISN